MSELEKVKLVTNKGLTRSVYNTTWHLRRDGLTASKLTVTALEQEKESEQLNLQ